MTHMMELLSTEFHYILLNGEQSLWINRQSGHFTSKSGVDIGTTGALCLGSVHGFIGKIQFGENAEPRLVFIRQSSRIGKLRACNIYKVTSVIAVSLEGDGDLLLEPCQNHHSKEFLDKSPSQPTTSGAVCTSFSDTGPRSLIRVKPIAVSPHPSQQNVQNSPRKQERVDKVEKRMLEEFYKMFTEADSFYYAREYDLTNSVQRHALTADKLNDKEKILPLWYGCDVRFFWNYYMMLDLIQSKDPRLDIWISPIIQGFVQHQRCSLNHLLDPVGPAAINIHGEIDLWIISRRSRFRAGTRYLRRGIDEDGKVANYVETEQIMVYKKHIISFVMTRGSIPLYWSQPGYRYRPPARLERSDEENYAAFRSHIDEEGGLYGPVTIITLLDKTGKEKVLGDAYLANVLLHNAADLSYFTFDFHENCRGMHFENVQLLIDKLDEKLKYISYCWIDSYGIVQTQTGVCRVNCMDCLDRTNVVQTFLGKHIICAQMSKLGLVSPEFGLPETVKRTLQTLWANNGDTISKQYAGTSALKGDYTRTGERRFAGALKDGMNSANRYYLNRFRDANRQAVIDITLGIRKNITEDELESEKLIEERENTAEQIKAVIDDTKKCVIPKFDVVIGSWGLINARDNDPIVIDVDTIFILTETSYYITRYDCSMDSITDTEKVKLTAITSIELGYEVVNQPLGFLGLFASGAQLNRIPSLRLNYTNAGASQFHQFRSSNMRFFNNVCVPIHQPEEMLDALKLIADTLQVAAVAQGNPVNLTQTGHLLPVKSGTKSGSSSTGSSWTQRYFSFGQQHDTNDDISRKSIGKSFERFTPKYFRRSSAADAARRAEAIRNTDGVSVMEVKNFKEMKNESSPSSIIDVSNMFDLSGVVLVETSTGISELSSDLVLPSCGLISVPSVTLQRPECPFSPSFLPHQSKINVEFQKSSPTSPQSTSPENEFIDYPPTSSNLKHHRFSLPTSSLVIGSSALRRQSPVTPEIKITEESLDHVSLLPGISIQLRLSKSSEDVVKCSNPIGPESFFRTRSSGSQLKPISSDSVRSTSDQDIFLSSLGNTMKGSHSDNSIKANNPFQRLTQGSVPGSAPFKKELVLAPLGKLARGVQNLGVNYLHPKKLKNTFKPGLRRDVEGMKSEDLEEVRILREKKLSCKSLIVDL